jgi:hypothetical protein
LGGGFVVGRALAAAWDLDLRPVEKDLVTLTVVTIAVTLGTSFGGVYGGTGKGRRWAGGSGGGRCTPGVFAGMAVEPVLALGLSLILAKGSHVVTHRGNGG